VDDRRVEEQHLVAVLEERMRHLSTELERSDKQRETDMAEIKDRMALLVHIARFRPVEAAVYGLILLIATGLVGILVTRIWGGH
jgi:hypothetical protein